MLAPNGLKRGDIVEAGNDVPKTIGNTLPLRNIPVGTLIHNIELKPGAGDNMLVQQELMLHCCNM